MRNLMLLVTAFFLSLLLEKGFPAYGGEFDGKLIETIQLKTTENLSEAEFFRLIEIKPGDFYDKRKIREGLQRLYLKGFFSDISVKAYPEDNGLRLVYETTPLITLAGYKIKGNPVFSDKEILNMVKPRKGEPFSEYQLKKSLEKLTRYYRDQGYFQAKINYQLMENQEKDKTSVYLLIEEAQVPSILSFNIRGNAAFTREQLLKKIKSRQGKTYNSTVLEKDIQKIIRLYLAKKYLTVRVEKTVVFHKEKMCAEIELSINQGPLFNIVFEGNSHIKSKKLLPLVKISPEEGYDSEVLEESKEAIIALYRKQGYHFVEVDTQVIDQEGVGSVTVKFLIKEGPRVKVSRIDATGNKKIDTEKIKEVMPTKEKGLFKGAIFQEKVWQEDLEKILSLYHGQGFLQASIEKSTLQFSEDKRSVDIYLTIFEGKQTIIRDISFQGNSHITNEELLKAIKGKIGFPYNKEQTEEDIAEILSLYLTRGFLHASINMKENFSGHEVGLLYIIEENSRTKLGDIFIWGNKKTKTRVITREFQEGEPYNPELLLSARQKLLRLGIFEGIDLSPFRTRAVDSLLVQDFQVKVREKPGNKITFGLGYDSEQEFRGSLGFTKTNIQGNNRDLSFSGQLNSLKRVLSMDYHEPWLFHRPIDGSAGIYLKEEEDRESFKLETMGAKLNLSKELLPSIIGNLRYELEQVRTKDVDPGAILSSKDKGELLLAHINPSFVRDTRDTQLDPSRGSVNNVGLKYFSYLWGSEADFFKVYGSSRWFLPIFRDHVLALSGQFGWVEKFRDTKQIPIAERFFTGGAETVRGFELNDIGPRSSDGSLIGGYSMAVFNLESRFRITEKLGGVLFVDMGNTWLENSDFLETLRKSAGFGIRLKTPLGSIRLDWGFKLDKKRDEDLSRIHFSFGHAF